jgi:hypothetical protein
MKCCPYFLHFLPDLDEVWYSRCPLTGNEILSVSGTAQQKPQSTECSKSFCIYTSHIYCPVWVKFRTWDLNIMPFSICDFHVISSRKTKLFVTSVNKMYLSIMTSPLHPSCFSTIPLFEAWWHFIITVTVITSMGKLQLLYIPQLSHYFHYLFLRNHHSWTTVSQEQVFWMTIIPCLHEWFLKTNRTNDNSRRTMHMGIKVRRFVLTKTLQCHITTRRLRWHSDSEDE